MALKRIVLLLIILVAPWASALPSSTQLAAYSDAPWGDWATGHAPGNAGVLHEGDATSLEFAFRGTSGQHVRLRLEADDYGTIARLVGPDGDELAAYTDPGPGEGAEMALTLPASGTYTLLVLNFGDEPVAFRMRVEPLAELFTFVDHLTRTDLVAGGDIVHRYVWSVRSGVTLHAWLDGDFDPYLSLADGAGGFLADADDWGNGARITVGPVESGAYILDVTSFSGDETGAYVFRLWTEVDGEPGHAGSEESPRRSDGAAADAVEAVVLPVGEMLHGEFGRTELLREYALPVSPGGTTFDVWLFAESDFDLYATAGTVDVASENHEGYEHVRISAPAGTEIVHVQVALYEAEAENRHFYLMAQEVSAWERADQGGEHSVPRPPHGTTDRRVFELPFAGNLEPGRRYAARILPDRFTTQVWTLYIPEGTTQASVGLFSASGDFDLSVEPGWTPSRFGEAHALRATTRRHNERLHIGGPGHSQTGWYTVAVWPAADDARTYEIEVAFDGPLPASSAYPHLSQEMTAAIDPARRVELATLLIEHEFGQGGGVVVTPDGLLLTNYHVVADCYAGTTPYGCHDGGGLDGLQRVGEYVLSLNDPVSGRLTQFFTARLIDARPEYDLALLELVADVDGNPVEGLHVPAVPLDVRRNAVAPDSSLASLGFSEVRWAGDRARPVQGQGNVTGFVDDQGTRLFWRIAGGGVGSGGAVVRPEDGRLVGLTTARHYTELFVEDTYLIRPATLIPDEWLHMFGTRGGDVRR